MMKSLLTIGVLILNMMMSAGVVAEDGVPQLDFADITFYELTSGGTGDLKVAFYNASRNKVSCQLYSENWVMKVTSFIDSSRGGYVKSLDSGICTFRVRKSR